MWTSVARGAGVVVVLLLASVIPAHATGGDLLWQSEGDTADSGRIGYITADARRILAVGYTGPFTATETPRLLARAYDAATGTVAWSHEDDSSPHGVAAHALLKGARAYVTGYLRRVDDELDLLVRSYDARTGRVLWQDRHDVAASTPGDSGIGQAVVLAAGRLFVVGYYFDPYGGPHGTMIRAYDASSGQLLWQDNRPGELFGTTEQHSLLVVGRHVIVALHRTPTEASDGALVVRAYEATTGKAVWEDAYSAHGDGDARAAIANAASRVFVAGLQASSSGDNDFVVRAYDSVSGALIWHQVRSEPGTTHEAVAITTAGSYVFAAANAMGATTPGIVRALDTRTGALVWEVVDDRDTRVTDLAVIGNRLVSVGHTAGKASDLDVRVFDTRTGARVWEDRHDVAGGLDYALTVAAGGARVFAAGAGTTAAGAEHTLIRAYRLR